MRVATQRGGALRSERMTRSGVHVAVRMLLEELMRHRFAYTRHILGASAAALITASLSLPALAGEPGPGIGVVAAEKPAATVVAEKSIATTVRWHRANRVIRWARNDASSGGHSCSRLGCYGYHMLGVAY